MRIPTNFPSDLPLIPMASCKLCHHPPPPIPLPPPPPPPPAAPNLLPKSSLASKTSELDSLLDLVGFEIYSVSAVEVTGRLQVTDRCCQPFKVLHGGVTALISEGMASMGAHVASGFRRVAGIQLSINHHRTAAAGDLVFARATPVNAGKTIQVWEVLTWRMNKSSMETEALISSSRVTIISNLPVPSNAPDADIALRKYAKL